MKSIIYSLGLALLFVLPGVALSQGYINWPATEDTILVPGNSVLNVFIGSDTAGTGPQGAHGQVAWQNRNRVYVLLAGQRYAWSAVCSLNVAHRSVYIRGERGKDYTIPSTVTSVERPVLRSISGTLTTAWFLLNADDQVFSMKNVCWTAYDENINPTDLRNATGTFVNCTANARPCVYLDSCVITGCLTVVQYAGRDLSVLTAGGKTIRIQNCIIGDNGSLQKSNLGAGRGVDLRSVGVDTLDMSNNTIFNVIDRVVRYLGSPKPIFSVKFNHNTIQNCTSYNGFVSLGWVDSSGNGPFEIKDNLFADNYAFGPDTDVNRQVEFTDNPDNDVNGLAAASWFICRKNNTSHVTPWVITNNYYNISDSGKAIRDFATPAHPLLYNSSSPERILTSDMAAQLKANGGNATTAFTKLTKLSFANATQFPSKFCRWYFSPLSDGYVPTTLAVDSCKGAGEGKLKYATAPMPHFILLTQFTQPYNQFNQFPYDLKRMTVDSIYNWLDCGFNASVDLSKAATDGKVVGSTMWKFGKVITAVGNDAAGMPNRFSLNQNYPNPFNPSTKIEYTLQNAGTVTLKVYNVLGQVIATLVSEKQDGGSHSVTFDASKFTSGVYFYQINTGNYTATRKMMLIK
jgi:nitrite reductase/ring-hydroxylating ferredoxin subunit